MQEFSVKEISHILSSILKNAFPEMVAVTGEISQVSKQNSSGHICFTLKEGDSVLNATYFKYYHTANNFMPKLGDKVKVFGEIKSYDKSSSYQINVKKIEYDSEGLLWKQFEEMKKKLYAEGLFDESRKSPVPKYPYRAAILTALTGAVIKDFIVTTKNEKGRYLIDVWNIPVQNIENAPVIADTILKAGSHTERYDVIVVMRGGGSVEDLAVFNQEVVARAAAASKVPLISAVGHETDFTIIDYVADYRAATPTAAAVYLSSHYKAAQQLLEKYIFVLNKNTVNMLDKKNQQLDMVSLKLESKSPLHRLIKLNHKISDFNNVLENMLNKKLYGLNKKLSKYEYVITASNPANLIEAYKVRIANSHKTLSTNMFARISAYNYKEIIFRKNIKIAVLNKLEKKSSRLDFYFHKLSLFNPAKKLDGYKYKFDIIEKSLLKAVKEKYAVSYRQLKDGSRCLEQYIVDYLFNKNADISLLESKLYLLDPQNVIERGYAVVTQKEKIISSVDNVEMETELTITLKDGVISAYPEEKNKNNTKNITELDNIEKILK